MAAPEPDRTAREIAQRARSRLPTSQTGAERRISDALIDALAPEFHSLYRRIGGVEQRLSERIDRVGDRLNARIDRLDVRIDELDANIDRLGEHMIDRLGDLDAKLDRLLSRTNSGQAQGD